MPTLITVDTITDSMIHELAGRATPEVRRICKIALDDAATQLRASVVRDARARCAEIINMFTLLHASPVTRSQTEPASDDEPRVTIALPEGAASVLQIDVPEIWRNVETVKVKRAGRGRSYVIELPVHDAEIMLKDCIVYGNTSMSGGEGADIDTSGKYGCRRAAERLALALNQVAPRWERG